MESQLKSLKSPRKSLLPRAVFSADTGLQVITAQFLFYLFRAVFIYIKKEIHPHLTETSLCMTLTD